MVFSFFISNFEIIFNKKAEFLGKKTTDNLAETPGTYMDIAIVVVVTSFMSISVHMSHKHIDMTRPLWLKVQYCPDVASYFSPYARLKVTVMGIFLTQT